MSQSTHDMSQAKTMESDAQKNEQKSGANTPVDSSYVHPTTSTSLGHQGDASPAHSNNLSPNSANGSGQSNGSTQGQSAQTTSQSSSAGNGIAAMSDSGKPSGTAGTAGTPVSGNNQVAEAANGSTGQMGSTPVVTASAKQNDMDSPHLKSFEQHLAQRYGPGSESLSDDQKHDLDKLLKQDKQGIQQDFAGGFNGVRDGMMGMIGKGQDQSVGAVQIRSSV